MAWFTADFNRFFKDLAKNNNTEWFDAGRQRYGISVKAPFVTFVAEVIARVAKLDPGVRITPREAVFRVNRDIRFSKDKTPYKLRMAALVSTAGRKDRGVPGIYFELGPEKVGIYGGCFTPVKDELHRIRRHIAVNGKEFKALRDARPFKERFGEVLGERNKVVPAEFKAALAREPLIANKQFYYMAELPPGTVEDPRLADILMEHYRAMRPLNGFLMAG